MFEEVGKALLVRAANAFGVSPLARKLKVSDGLVAAWLSGQAPMPERALVQLAALLEKHGEPLAE